jgi:hypothetical protein
MNRTLTAALALAISLVLTPLLPAEDLLSPKPPGGTQPIRVLLYIEGSSGTLDYPDVMKVLCSEPAKIVFETFDNCVVVHQGAYTVIQQRTSFSEHQARGVRFYDVK